MATAATKSEWAEVLDDTVAAVFEAMLGVAVEPAEDAQWTDGDDRIAASIEVSGTWTGVLTLEAPRDLASALAARYLSVDSLEELADVWDVMGELVNMIGGNLKSAICPGSVLSSPMVTEASHLRPAPPDGDRRAYRCREGLLWVFRANAGGPA